ncbi:MAG TPA: hypothetical protein VFK05_35110 [Polyangiaceae bacterium]|nr:hypothetical protein [Polyangiaceae bacterium]
MITEPCPANSDGSAHRCLHCHEPIANGALVLDFGRHGYQHYPSCDGVPPDASATPANAPDNGDKVAAALAASERVGASDTPFRELVSEELFKSTGHRLPAVAAQANESLDNGDKVAAAMGLTLPPNTRSQQ